MSFSAYMEIFDSTFDLDACGTVIIYRIHHFEQYDQFVDWSQENNNVFLKKETFSNTTI